MILGTPSVVNYSNFKANHKQYQIYADLHKIYRIYNNSMISISSNYYKNQYFKKTFLFIYNKQLTLIFEIFAKILRNMYKVCSIIYV